MCKTIKPITGKKGERGEEGSKRREEDFKIKRRKEGEREVGWT